MNKSEQQLRDALADLADRAERARGILTVDGGNWGMLDTEKARAALASTPGHPRLDFNTLRGILRLAGVTERELSGDRMYEVLPKVLELLGKLPVQHVGARLSAEQVRELAEDASEEIGAARVGDDRTLADIIFDVFKNALLAAPSIAQPIAEPPKRVYRGLNGLDYEAELKYIEELDAKKAAEHREKAPAWATPMQEEYVRENGPAEAGDTPTASPLKDQRDMGEGSTHSWRGKLKGAKWDAQPSGTSAREERKP